MRAICTRTTRTRTMRMRESGIDMCFSVQQRVLQREGERGREREREGERGNDRKGEGGRRGARRLVVSSLVSRLSSSCTMCNEPSPSALSKAGADPRFFPPRMAPRPLLKRIFTYHIRLAQDASSQSFSRDISRTSPIRRDRRTCSPSSVHLARYWPHLRPGT